MTDHRTPVLRRLSRAAIAYLIYFINLALVASVVLMLFAKRFMLAGWLFAFELVFASSRWLQSYGAQSRRGLMGLFRNITLTTDGWAFAGLTVFLTVAALNSSYNLLYLIFAVLYSTLIVSGILGKASTGGLEIRRVLPAAVEAGKDFTIRLIVKNTKSRMPAYAVHIQDCPLESPTDLPRQVWAPIIKPREEMGLRYTAMIARRGLAGLHNVRVMSIFPFGLLEQWYFQNLDDELIVWPRMGRLLRPLEHYVSGPEEQLSAAADRRGLEEEFRSVRDFRTGDNHHHIHWRTTARKRKLMVREFERRLDRRVSIYLDTFIKNDPLDEECHRRTELAISFVATIVREFLRADYQVNLAMFAPELCLLCDLCDRSQIAPALNRLALARANRERDLTTLFESARNLIPPATAAIVVRISRHFGTTNDYKRFTRSMRVKVFDATTNDIETVFRLQ